MPSEAPYSAQSSIQQGPPHELAVATLTPSWEPLAWACILQWGRKYPDILAEVYQAYADAKIDLTPAITANTASITIEDGLDWL